MKVLLTGGGTGGHITPLLAVAHKLKLLEPKTRVIYIGERHGKFSHLTKDNASIDRIYSVHSGKFRRYHNQSWLVRLLDISTNFKNIRDVLLITIGIVQSWFLLRKLRPDMVFLKGGYVGVPVGMAAAMLHIPFVTHDSDAVPGLANRLVSKWALKHATALPAEAYAYPAEKVVHAGVIVSEDYRPVDATSQTHFKSQLKLPQESPLLLVTGGSLGAVRLNHMMTKLVDELLSDYPKLQIVHQVGKGKSTVYGDYTHERLHVLEFLSPMHVYTGAADIVVTRAGANTVAELGVQGKACIVVPNHQLTGGHQLQNARRWQAEGAAIIVDESEGSRALDKQIRHLLDDSGERRKLAARLRAITIDDAAGKMAKLLLDAGAGK